MELVEHKTKTTKIKTNKITVKGDKEAMKKAKLQKTNVNFTVVRLMRKP